MSLSTLLRNLRLRAEGKSNPITALEELREKLAQEQKRRAEAELEACTLRRRLSAYEKPRDTQGRYTKPHGAATCTKQSTPHRNALPKVT